MLYLELSNKGVLRWRLGTRFPVLRQFTGSFEPKIEIVSARADSEELAYLKTLLPELFKNKTNKTVVHFCKSEAQTIYEKLT